MRSPHRPVLTALALAVGAAFSLPAAAEDLLEVYELARASDPQIAVVDANRRALSEGVAQSRAALTPTLARLAEADVAAAQRAAKPSLTRFFSFARLSK